MRENAPLAMLGDSNVLWVNEPSTRYTLLRFDTSALSGTVTAASLKLRLQTLRSAGNFEIRRLLGPWDQASVSYATLPAIGANIDAVASLESDDEGELVVVDISTAVQSWIDDPSNNFGIVLVPRDGLRGRFLSSESGNAPELDVIADNPEPPVAPMAIESVALDQSAGLLTIVGQNFLGDAAPSVVLGSLGALELVGEPSDTTLIAALPENLEPGEQQLRVSNDANRNASYSLTISGPSFSGYENIQECITIPTLQPGESWGKITHCPTGKKVLGGGGIGSVWAVIQRSHPNGDFSWWVVVKNVDDVPRSATPLCVWAICASID